MKGALTFISIFSIVLIIIDLYTFKGVRLFLKSFESTTITTSVTWVYWVISVAVLSLLWYNYFTITSTLEARSYKIPFSIVAVFVIYLVPKLFFIVFHLLEDVLFVGAKGVAKIISSESGEVLTRKEFLKNSLTNIGVGVGILQLGALTYAVARGRFNFQVVHQPIEFNNLPQSFNGLKIVQLSDMHMGSFFDNHDEVKKAIDKVNELEPDYIFFTGDMVNNYAWELDGWEEIIGSLKAKYGKFSILGNHDYADYVQWDSAEEKEKNLNDLKERQKRMGFKLLTNESVRLESGGEFIELLGLENWGKGRFAKYGDLSKTMANVDKDSFKILMSHDPSHWDEQVLEKTNIDLALAGHTHGMQYGVKIGSFQISPVRFRYPRWAGLYKENDQCLYVNRGFGYIGFPGRVGILPEITLIELLKKV